MAKFEKINPAKIKFSKVGENDKYFFTAEQNAVESSDFQERSVY